MFVAALRDPVDALRISGLGIFRVDALNKKGIRESNAALSNVVEYFPLNLYQGIDMLKSYFADKRRPHRSRQGNS